MNGNVFSREENVILGARALFDARSADNSLEEGYKDLLSEYERLVRQSKRLLKMGDRMQLALAKLNKELAVREQTYRGIFENAIEGIYRTDAQGDLLEVNEALAVMLGYENPAQLLENATGIKSIFCNDNAYRQYKSVIGKDHMVKGMQAKLKRVDGTITWVEINAGIIQPECSDTDSCSGVVGVIVDITEPRQMMREMCRLARTDSLTGLWNRGHFVEQAVQEIARCKRSKRCLSLLLIDVDFFKRINDQYGHDVGDKVLVGIADTLRETLRDIDIVARFGGEEFVILLPDTKLEAAKIAAERVRNAIGEQDFSYDRHRSITTTVSIGVTSFDNYESDLDAMLKRADTAMYVAKRKGRNRVESCLLDIAG